MKPEAITLDELRRLVYTLMNLELAYVQKRNPIHVKNLIGDALTELRPVVYRHSCLHGVHFADPQATLDAIDQKMTEAAL